jgi:hypothetical protein
MVARERAGTDWFGRLLTPAVSILMSMTSAGVVIYFSSQAAAIAQLRADMTVVTNEIRALTFQNKEDIALSRQLVEANAARLAEIERRRR